MNLKEQTQKTIWKIFLGTVILSLLLYGAYIFLDIIVMLTISLLLAMIFNPLVSILEKKNIPRIISVLIVFLVSGVMVVLGLSVLIPKIAVQMNTITKSLTQENVGNIIAKFETIINDLLPFINTKDLAPKLSDLISSLFFDTINNLSDILTSIISVIAISVIVPFMTFFILKDNRTIIKGIINIMPNKYFEMSYSVINQISKQLGRFVRGWILDAFLVGLAITIGLAFLGIKNSITIGFVAGVGHLIPYFGPVIGGLPAILISLIQFGDFSKLPSILILFLIIYSLDNGYIQPNVFSKSTDLHPLMIIILILAGSQIMGILGMLLAVPTATVIRTAAREIYNGYKNYKIIKL